MQHSPAPPGPHRRGSSGTSDGGYDAQENTPAWQSAQTPEQQQHQQLHSSSYLWQQFKPPAPPTLQQQQEDQVGQAVQPGGITATLLGVYGSLQRCSFHKHHGPFLLQRWSCTGLQATCNCVSSLSTA